MASSESILQSPSLKAPAIPVQVVDLVSDEDSSDDAVNVHFDRDANASNRVGAIESDENDDDDDDWSLYEDVLDVIESDEIVPGGKVLIRVVIFGGGIIGSLSNVS